MASELFMKMFIEADLASQEFSFEKLRTSLNVLTPQINRKIGLSYDLDKKEIIQHSKESIIRNLCLHPSIIQSPKFDHVLLRDFFYFIQDDSFSESKLAQCFYLLHGSKSDYSSVDLGTAKQEFQQYFMCFSTIDVNVNISKYHFLTDLMTLFNKIIKATIIKDKVNLLIQEVVEKSDEFNYDKVELIFFNSNFEDLDGFSGRNAIYVNLNRLIKLNNFLISDTKKNITMKLNFLALIIHELSHIVLRFKLKDFNLSSPELVRIGDKDIKKNVNECGFNAEIKFFKHVIDWFGSASVINNEYCENYLSNIFNDNFVELDIEKACLFTIPPESLPKMAFRCRLIKHFSRF
ncbi:hypothetical protein BpHYR1_011252 [Brachionus plicatilis]|uniref:Uncharacterized protein n=1 Tax=Brachionus plicatilis TaxID=10195 RepID=A0A3M7RD18_BRAPC|nr:hypothetical protein BpHYR1_011252 [Brachionus plicatilis]